MLLKSILVTFGAILLSILCRPALGGQTLPCSNTSHPLVRSKLNYGGMARDSFANNQSEKESRLYVSKTDPENTPLKIVSKPKAARTNSSDCSEGLVSLRVQFLANGQIGKIYILKGLTRGVNRDAIMAAKRMKFEPATKNGKRIRVTKIVEYSFFIY